VRVLVISAAFPPMRAGEATNALYLCRHLADRKLDVHVLTSQSNTAIDDSRITIHPIMRQWSWLEILRVGTFLKRCSPDVILLMYIGWIYNYHPMITFVPTISKRLLPRVPFVTRFESALSGAAPWRTSRLSRAVRKAMAQWAGLENVSYNFGTLLRDSDRIIVLCGHHGDVLSKEFSGLMAKTVLSPPPPNMLICPENNGAARECGRRALGVKDNDFVIAYLGYIYPRKGVETLLRAFQIVRRQGNNVRLVVIGGKIEMAFLKRPSYLQEMHELSRHLGIDDNVTWTGEYTWDDDQASVYLRAADACVLPFDDGVRLNNSSFSCAAAHALPIITTQGEMLEAAFVDGENVFLCPPRNPSAVADAIKLLMDNPDVCGRLRTGARNLAQEWFSWEKAIDCTMATFGVDA